jgi:cytochrome c biogenesis protein CcmG, thiol:disulfide interchange protein DsbE
MSPLANVDQSNLDQSGLDDPMVAQPKAGRPKGWRERTGSRFGTILVLVVTAVLVGVGAKLVDRPNASEDGITAIKLSQEGKGDAPKIGSPAQDFTATAVDGTKVSLSSYKGKAVWLSFGATWCAPCQAEAPDIQAAHVKSKAKGVVVLGLFISEDSATVRDYGERIGLTFPQIADPNDQVASAYRVNGIPVHYFIDRTGVLRNIVTGSMDPERMDSELAKIS